MSFLTSENTAVAVAADNLNSETPNVKDGRETFLCFDLTIVLVNDVPPWKKTLAVPEGIKRAENY